MAKSAVKAPYRSDQRNLVVSLWADPKGGTRYHVYWRSCLAGEEHMREVTLLKGHWGHYMNDWRGMAAGLLWLAKRFKELQDAAGE